MALKYKIEFVNDDSMARDESLYIHLLEEIIGDDGKKVLYDHFTKEEYFKERINPETGLLEQGWHFRKPFVQRPPVDPVRIQLHDFVDGLFALPGVVETSIKSYRLWIMKATAFHWDNPLNEEQDSVLPKVLEYLMNWFDETELFEIPPICGIGNKPIGSQTTLGGIPSSTVKRAIITKDRRRL